MSRSNKDTQTKDTEAFIGKLVFSLSSGIGEITSISQMDDGLEDYFVIKFKGNNLVDYSRVDGKRQFRVMAPESNFEKALDFLSDDKKPTVFESKKDRVHYFKDLQNTHDLMTLVTLIKEMSSLKDLGMVEKSILKRCLDSFILEYGLQKSLEEEASRKEVESLMAS